MAVKNSTYGMTVFPWFNSLCFWIPPEIVFCVLTPVGADSGFPASARPFLYWLTQILLTDLPRVGGPSPTTVWSHPRLQSSSLILQKPRLPSLQRRCRPPCMSFFSFLSTSCSGSPTAPVPLLWRILSF